MAVKRITIHCVDIEDKPGSLQKFLTQSSLSNVDFLCFTAFSTGDNRGRIYLSAKKLKVFETFAQEAKIKTTTAAGFIISGEDKLGAAAEALKDLAEAQIKGVAGAAIARDGQYQMLIVVNAADGDTAEKTLGT